jgi:hypothetical protein
MCPRNPFSLHTPSPHSVLPPHYSHSFPFIPRAYFYPLSPRFFSKNGTEWENFSPLFWFHSLPFCINTPFYVSLSVLCNHFRVICSWCSSYPIAPVPLRSLTNYSFFLLVDISMHLTPIVSTDI